MKEKVTRTRILRTTQVEKKKVYVQDQTHAQSRKGRKGPSTKETTQLSLCAWEQHGLLLETLIVERSNVSQISCTRLILLRQRNADLGLLARSKRKKVIALLL